MGPYPTQTRYLGHPRANMASRLTTPYLKAMLNEGWGGFAPREEGMEGQRRQPPREPPGTISDRRRICCSGEATTGLLCCPGATSEPETRRAWLLPLARRQGLKEAPKDQGLPSQQRRSRKSGSWSEEETWQAFLAPHLRPCARGRIEIRLP